MDRNRQLFLGYWRDKLHSFSPILFRQNLQTPNTIIRWFQPSHSTGINDDWEVR